MDFYEFYQKIKVPEAKDKIIFAKLDGIYKHMPETKGCIENINKEEGCKGWCCSEQSPQLLYSEFLNIYDFISKKMSNKQFLNIIEKAMNNSIMGNTNKGCIFFNEETKMCDIHQKRSFNCRIYGITPDEMFNSRYEKIQKQYEEIEGAFFYKQCNKVFTINGEEITSYDINKWWESLVQIENILGIPENKINDNIQGGSYRTPHDHLLLYLMPDNVIYALSGIRLYNHIEERKKAVEELMNKIRELYYEN